MITEKTNKFNIIEDSNFKTFISKNYNYYFNKMIGFLARCGETKDIDPPYSPFGPEIADIEITTICSGVDGTPCKFCYKSNSLTGSYMSLETFKKIFHLLPRTLTQIAFGVDATCTSNPDTFKIMEYCRKNCYQEIIPNVTVANINDQTAEQLATVCGAIAVSRYNNSKFCYDSIKKLRKYGARFVNIHTLVSRETLPIVKETLEDYIATDGLYGLNAIVLLSLKQKGRGQVFTPVSQEEFDSIVDFALKYDIPLGFDSCSAKKFSKSVNSDIHKYINYIEPCESSLFSTYINVHGHVYPCSFIENEKNWVEGLDILGINDYINDVWFNERMIDFRRGLLSSTDYIGMRSCPVFNI